METTEQKSAQPVAERKKGSGGPRTERGKAVSARNGVTHGIFASWLDAAEQELYTTQVEKLMAEYDDGTATARMLVEKVAGVMVKQRRIQMVEDALYQKARLLSAYRERMPHPGSITSMLPADATGEARGVEIAAAAAMPDLERLDALARYDTSYDKKLVGYLNLLKVLKDERLAAMRQALPPATVLPALKRTSALASNGRSAS